MTNSEISICALISTPAFVYLPWQAQVFVDGAPPPQRGRSRRGGTLGERHMSVACSPFGCEGLTTSTDKGPEATAGVDPQAKFFPLGPRNPPVDKANKIWYKRYR